MWCYACSWVVRGYLTLNCMAQIHTSLTLLTLRDLAWSSGRLTCQHVSQISAVAQISWDVTCASSSLQTLPVVSGNGGNADWKVLQRTFLYDTKASDYRDHDMRANAWEGIGKELKIKRKLCELIWREGTVLGLRVCHGTGLILWYCTSHGCLWIHSFIL
jgi:hypothetical protein